MRHLSFAALLIAALPASAQNLDEGAAAFANHCAGCHGPDAQGNGPLAKLLTVPPADLTTLAASNGGVFPIARVVMRIDGTSEVAAHGDPMPAFGLLMQGPSEVNLAPDGSEVTAPEGIANIASWLEQLQIP